MKKIILSLVISVVGALLIGGGAAYAALMNYMNTVSFKEYTVESTYSQNGLEGMTANEIAELKAKKRIKYPSFKNGRGYMFVPELGDTYNEVDSACINYAWMVSDKFANNADLDFTVDLSGNTLTIAFTGVGYPENGEPESLDRTYIFDIEGAGANKLPRLVNRADIIGY